MPCAKSERLQATHLWSQAKALPNYSRRPPACETSTYLEFHKHNYALSMNSGKRAIETTTQQGL